MTRSRWPVVFVMLVSLVGVSGFRRLCLDWQIEASGKSSTVPVSGIAQLNSYALALVLGGLRGPLVNYLWTSSEAQKNDRNLEDFDAKLEWIRLLQPEFDTVHLFQIWNKAYNISALLASPADKYICIMQAIEYADNVLKEKPGDLNILATIGETYSIKMGAHAIRPEQDFYNRQLREESMTDAARKVAYPDDPNYQRLWERSLMLDDHNRIRPEFLQPTRQRPAGLQGDWNDGSTLQYLKQFEPFDLGVSPAAMDYNYAKRAQVAQTVDGQKPLQLSPMVIDSGPAIALEQWSQQEMDLAQEDESRAFNIPQPPRVAGMPAPADYLKLLSSIPPLAPASDPLLLQHAIRHYEVSARLCAMANLEIERHISNPAYAQRYTLYASHLLDNSINAHLSTANREYLLVRTQSDPAESRRLLGLSVSEYALVIDACERIVLKYYTDDRILRGTLPSNMTKAEFDKLSNMQIDTLYRRSLEVGSHFSYRDFDDSRQDYVAKIDRATTRIKLLTGH